jgi:hypothetical protein
MRAKMGSVDLSAIASYLVLTNLLYGGFLAAVGTRGLIRNVEEYGQKFYGLTLLIKGIALILISLFLYYQLSNGLKVEYVIYVLILGPLLSSYKELWDLVKRMYRAMLESRADILVQLNNMKWQELEDRKIEYTSSLINQASADGPRDKLKADQ